MTLTLFKNAVISLQKKGGKPAMKKNITIGMDLGDQSHVVVVLDKDGDEIEMRTISNTEFSLVEFFSQYPKATVAIEAGTHSPWISRLYSGPQCQDSFLLNLSVYIGWIIRTIFPQFWDAVFNLHFLVFDNCRLVILINFDTILMPVRRIG
jgi:hypothetical protein